MFEVVSVRFEKNKSRTDFLASDLDLRIGDRCVVRTDRGVELGMVMAHRRLEEGPSGDARLHHALRKATIKDLFLFEQQKEREEVATKLCRKRARARKLPLKLSKVEYLFDGSRVIFYFTADGRIDFRQLVKDLARELRTRIEMRQIGARDEAKLIGGQGCCGTGQNCSARFLKELKSVTVKTAKSQDLSINPSRLSGMCGRLKCCLNFESEVPGCRD